MRLWHPASFVGARGHECVVVAQSLTPKRAGDRVKTDRRFTAPASFLATTPRAERADGGVGSRSRTRGDARPGARPSRRGACTAPGAPAAFLLPVAPRLPLRAAGLDQIASPAGSPGSNSRQAVHLPRRVEDYVQAVEAAEARRDQLTAQIAAMLPAGLDAGAGRGGAADDTRYGIGQCRSPDRRGWATCRASPTRAN